MVIIETTKVIVLQLVSLKVSKFTLQKVSVTILTYCAVGKNKLYVVY